MVLHLADHLDVPLRDRNALLLAAGYAPAFGAARPRRPRDGPPCATRSTTCSPATSPTRRSSSTAAGSWSRRTAPSRCSPTAWRRELLEPPVNVLRAQPAPGRPGAADRQPARVARAPARPAAPPGRRSPATPRWRRCCDELAALPGGGRPTSRPAAAGDRRPAAAAQRRRRAAFLSTVATFGTAVT